MMTLWQQIWLYLKWLPAIALMAGLSGCDKLHVLIKDNKNNIDADKALGAACRQTGRSLEECFSRNNSSDKAAIYTGWIQMNEYMAKNKMPNMTPMPDANTASNQIILGGQAPENLASGIDPQVQAILSTLRNQPQKSVTKSSTTDQPTLSDEINNLNKDKKAPVKK